MMTFSADDGRLADDEAALVGQPAGTPLTELSPDALLVLATHYYNRDLTAAYLDKYHGMASSSAERFVAFRLKTLAGVMGAAAFGALEAEKHAEWIRTCVAADAAERALTPCVTCGRSRTLADAFPEQQGRCGECWSE